MNYVLIRHQVANFKDWKQIYDSHAPKREAAGLKEEMLLQNADHKNEVILLFSAADLQKARAFADSPELRQAMQVAGVTDAPEIHFLHD